MPKSSIDDQDQTTQSIVCFIDATVEDFANSIHLDDEYDTAVELVPCLSERYVYFDITSRKFYKYFDTVKADKFSAYAMNHLLEDGAIFEKIDWQFKPLAQKALIKRMLKRLESDMHIASADEFLKLYN